MKTTVYSIEEEKSGEEEEGRGGVGEKPKQQGNSHRENCLAHEIMMIVM